MNRWRPLPLGAAAEIDTMTPTPEGQVRNVTEVQILSFEGPDPYARAGGISSRVTGLSEALATLGHPTHLWFVGDPERSGQESVGNLHLHRWCQWISRHHPLGVYDGEEGKWREYAYSLPGAISSTAICAPPWPGEAAS